MIELSRPQISFAEALIEEEVGSLWVGAEANLARPFLRRKVASLERVILTKESQSSKSATLSHSTNKIGRP